MSSGYPCDKFYVQKNQSLTFEWGSKNFGIFRNCRMWAAWGAVPDLQKKENISFCCKFCWCYLDYVSICMRNCNAININFVSRGRNCKLYSVETFCKSRRTLKLFRHLHCPRVFLSVSHTQRNWDKRTFRVENFSPYWVPFPNVNKENSPLFPPQVRAMTECVWRGSCIQGGR